MKDSVSKKETEVVPEEQNPRLTSGFHMHTYAEIQTQEVGEGGKNEKEL